VATRHDLRGEVGNVLRDGRSARSVVDLDQQGCDGTHGAGHHQSEQQRRGGNSSDTLPQVKNLECLAIAQEFPEDAGRPHPQTLLLTNRSASHPP
jgi:hypothetical protein